MATLFGTKFEAQRGNFRLEGILKDPDSESRLMLYKIGQENPILSWWMEKEGALRFATSAVKAGFLHGSCYEDVVDKLTGESLTVKFYPVKDSDNYYLVIKNNDHHREAQIELEPEEYRNLMNELLAFFD